MTKFRKGDIVKCVTEYIDTPKVIGKEGTFIDYEEGETNYCYVDFGPVTWLKDSNDGKHYMPGRYMGIDEIELVREAEPKPINYLLQYELDEDPVEEFETLLEVEKRIKELAERDDLQRDSIRVFEIASVHNITLDTKVVGLPKRKYVKKTPKKRGPGRPRKQTA